MNSNADILITSFNRGKYLREAIESALKQSVAPRRVIIVDDDSTDDSRDTIRSYGSSVKAVYQSNAGQAAAMNAALEFSQADAVLFLDCDDVLCPDAVLMSLPKLDDPRVAKVHWPVRVIDAGGRETGKLLPQQLPSCGDLQDQLIAEGPECYEWPPTSGNLWRRSTLIAIGPIPPEQFRICPDVYLAAMVPLFGTIATIDVPLSCWRRHDCNSTWAERFEVRLPRFCSQWDSAAAALAAECARRGVKADVNRWKQRAWCHRVTRAIQRIVQHIPEGTKFALIDHADWGADERFFGRRCVPFPHRLGIWNGLPASDEEATLELQHAIDSGVAFFVHAWPGFWWREQFPNTFDQLRSICRVTHRDDDLEIYELVTR